MAETAARAGRRLARNEVAREDDLRSNRSDAPQARRKALVRLGPRRFAPRNDPNQNIV
jgi:hypothetical protein